MGRRTSLSGLSFRLPTSRIEAFRIKNLRREAFGTLPFRIPAFALILVLICFLALPAGSLPSSAETPGEVLGSGTLSARSILKGEKLRFTLTLKNKTDKPIESVRLLSVPDSYVLQEICVPDAEQEQNCPKNWDLSRSSLELAKTLPPGQSFTAWGYLTATTTHKPATLTVLIAWNPESAATKIPPTIAVTLGENQVQSTVYAKWAWVNEFILKVFAIPAMLLLVGFILDQIAKRRENRRDEANSRLEDQRADAARQREEHRADAEKKREELRQDLQQQQALRAETWKQMLPISHQYAAKFYLPLSLAAERFADALEASNHKLAFFYLLYSGKRMIATRNEIGGFYFKDLHGEHLAAQCWKRQRRACLGDEDDERYLAVRAAIERIEDTDNYEAFLAEFAGDPKSPVFDDDQIQRAWELFEKWMAEKKAATEAMPYLRGFTAVLDFESNRAYTYWYDSPARLIVTKEIEDLLRSLLKEGNYPDQEITEYFKSVTRPK